jgi:hypothetical protein
MNAMTSVNSFTIPLNWQPVLIDDNAFPWHRKSPRYLKNRARINGSQVYRWVFRGKNHEVEAVYIGQSEVFQKRISYYRGLAKKKDSEFAKCEEQGGVIELEFLHFDKFEVNGKRIDDNRRSLGDHDVRLLLECIAIVTAKLEKPRVLNRLLENADKKQLRHLMKKMLHMLSPKRQQEVIDKAFDLIERQIDNGPRETNATQK